MADFVSHHLFGEQALEVFPASVQQIAARRPACFCWGCQGPDPLFYRRIALGSPLHGLGNRMHSERTDELFAALARAVDCLTGDNHEIAAAYFYGFLCHYALDSEIHPYVYCRQEQIRSADAKLSASAVHCQIESDIDYLVYERLYQEPVTSFEPEQDYTLLYEEKAVLAVLLHAVLRSVYGEAVPTRDLRRAFDEMLAWQTFLYSDSRLVYRGARRAERLAGRGALLTGHMKVERPEWDALNEERDPWNNLWTPGETRTDTVPELFGLARIRVAALAAQYAAQFETGWQLKYHFELPFDNGSPKRLVMPRD
ncbi:MAG: zinc dependent phospholipase C family protein [Eubacteriales bacterium]|nr:zinc dependent phospholipase C family protein [Eubacteriales bacterium]